ENVVSLRDSATWRCGVLRRSRNQDQPRWARRRGEFDLQWLTLQSFSNFQINQFSNYSSPQICDSLTITSTALFISCTLTNSCFEWMACSPAKRLGHGSPMKDNLLPSVPPRMLSIFTSSPASVIALLAFSTTCGC